MVEDEEYDEDEEKPVDEPVDSVEELELDEPLETDDDEPPGQNGGGNGSQRPEPSLN